MAMRWGPRLLSLLRGAPKVPICYTSDEFHAFNLRHHGPVRMHTFHPWIIWNWSQSRLMITKAEWTDRRLLLPKRQTLSFATKTLTQSWVLAEHHTSSENEGSQGLTFQKTWASCRTNSFCRMCWSAFQIISHMRQQLKLFHPLGDFSSCKHKWGVSLLQYRVQATLLSNIHKCKELHIYIYICNHITHITHIYTYSVDVSKWLATFR